MTYLDRAIKDGYAIITGPENKQKIIYVTSDNHTENYNDPEEKVRAEFWAELIYEYDYPAHRIKVEVTIPDRVPTDRADIVIFSDDECKKPYAVVECKRDGVTDAEFLQAIEQGVGNATWVKLRASYVVIIAGATRRVLDFSDDSTGILERENNIIADLPKAYGKPQAFRFYRGGEYTDVDGKKKKAPDIQPVAREDLITAIKKCHNTLWGGGRLSPPTAFGELCKLIFVKISDEQKPRKKGEPYQFQIKTHEPSSKLAERINALYNEQKVKDPEVFTDSIKVDDRVLRTVVSHLESINLNKTDLDVKGVAFEQFKLIVEDDYRIDVELGENYSQTFEKESQRRIIAEPFNLRGDNTDRDFFEKVANAFYEDLGVHFKVLESVLHHLSDSSFSHDNVEFDEIAPNVIKAKATDVLNDYLSFVVENVPVEDVKSAYDFLTIVPGQLKTICDTTHPILPIWEREKRNHCFAVRPIYMSNNDYIYSPIIMEEVRKRWIEGFLQFYPPFEIGLERTCTALYAWKNNYEHLFSSEVEVLLKESGCEYAKHDVDLRREDRRGNHPTIDVLGDYDVIGLNTTQKRIFIIECKVLQPIGSVFEHSNQQKRFFTKEKFDEKFQKRIDYFSKVAMSFFANHGYDTEGFTINPYMVVNKVFSSYYKHVQFPIVTFDELKREIQL